MERKRDAILSYAEAERALALMFKASPEAQVGAFRARLKHLKRLGIPLGINPGRGKKIGYRRAELYQWCFCLEFEEFGIDPSIIARIVRRYWQKLLGPGFDAISKEHENAEKSFFCFVPQLMSAGWRPQREFRGISAPFGFRGRKDLNDLLGIIDANQSRVSLFNVSDRVRAIENAFIAKEKQRLESSQDA